jgi:uncharacterized protein (DUF58 family)
VTFPVPTLRFAAVVAASIVVLLAVGSAWVFWSVETVVLVAAVVDLLLAPSPRRIKVERIMPASGVLDSPLALAWRVEHPGGRGLTVSVADQLAPSLRAGRRRGTDFDQLRDYTPDDESRRIDWAATARTGRPIVRTYRAEQNQVVVTLLDNGRVMAGQVAGVPRVEHAMDAAMALTSVAARLGDRAGLVAFDATVRAVVPPGTGARQVGRVADVFPELYPVLAESDYAGAFADTLARFRRRALLVVLTDLVEQAMLESLLPALPLIASRHRVIIAAVHDPAVVRWARMAPADAEEAYRAAAAVDALEERNRSAARLRGLGATVVDAEPGQLAGKLCDIYLDVKATGAL